MEDTMVELSNFAINLTKALDPETAAKAAGGVIVITAGTLAIKSIAKTVMEGGYNFKLKFKGVEFDLSQAKS